MIPRRISTSKLILLCTAASFMSACQVNVDSEKISSSVGSIWERISGPEEVVEASVVEADQDVKDLLRKEEALSDHSSFKNALMSAVLSDPEILKSLSEIAAKQADVAQLQAGKGFKIDGRVYGGVEDVTDKTAGAAIVLSATKNVYDFGKLDSEISAEKFLLDALKFELEVEKNAKSVEFGSRWVELERVRGLLSALDARLAVLEPLLGQLERVADAGVASVQEVASARGTLSSIMVEKARLDEAYQQAKIDYIDAFGKLPSKVLYDEKFVNNLVPNSLTDEAVLASSSVLAAYSDYRATVKRYEAVKSESKFQIGFEARASRPFADSSYGSDESIGLVLSKNLFDGGALDAKIERAELSVEAAKNRLKSVHRNVQRSVASSLESVGSLRKARQLAANKAALAAQEVEYQRQQFIIGASTLESIVSSESRLFQAKSDEINYLANLRKAKLKLVGELGLLSTSF